MCGVWSRNPIVKEQTHSKNEKVGMQPTDIEKLPHTSDACSWGFSIFSDKQQRLPESNPAEISEKTEYCHFISGNKNPFPSLFLELFWSHILFMFHPQMWRYNNDDDKTNKTQFFRKFFCTIRGSTEALLEFHREPRASSLAKNNGLQDERLEVNPCKSVWGW